MTTMTRWIACYLLLTVLVVLAAAFSDLGAGRSDTLAWWVIGVLWVTVAALGYTVLDLEKTVSRLRSKTGPGDEPR